MFSKTREVGSLGVSFSDMTPETAYVDVFGEVSADFLSALWANYFLSVALKLEDRETVDEFMDNLEVWAEEYAPLVHSFDSDEEREEAVGRLPFSNYTVKSMRVAKATGRLLIDELCFAEIHEGKRGTVPFLRNMKLTPAPFKSESALASVIGLAKWIFKAQPFFLTELPRFSLEIIEKAASITIGSTKGIRFESLCAKHAYEAIEVAMAKISVDFEYRGGR